MAATATFLFKYSYTLLYRMDDSKWCFRKNTLFLQIFDASRKFSKQWLVPKNAVPRKKIKALNTLKEQLITIVKFQINTFISKEWGSSKYFCAFRRAFFKQILRQPNK